MARNKRIVYLDDKPRSRALEELLQKFEFTRKVEKLQTVDILNRVSSGVISAPKSYPHYHSSAMDGVAVIAEETFEAHERNPLILQPNQYNMVDTGNAIPAPFNAVIMIEKIQELDDGSIEIIEPATPWQHIRPIGEDIVEDEVMFLQEHKFRPVDIGALLACGILDVDVIKKPVVSIIPTGHELVQPHEAREKGKLIEFNGTVFANYIKEWGGEPNLFPIITDEKDAIRQAILDATEVSDIVVVNAGSSAGRKDFTYSVVAELGEVFTHGVACRPGKPVILGKVNEKVVIGIPGYPVSAYLSLEWFIKPLIAKFLGQIPEERQAQKIKLGRRVVSTMGAEEFVRMNVCEVNGEFVGIPLSRSAGVTMSLVRADALLIIPAEVSGYEAGEEVFVELLKPVAQIAKRICFTGSHDMILDMVASELKLQDKLMLSTHVGSMAGILAVKKNEAHVAGIHLLDPTTNEYNTSYVKKFAGTEKMVIQPFLKRKQGLIVPKGNPNNLSKIEDIIDKKMDYVNRQKGAGTRILFDALLKESGVDPTEVKGYHREFFSHLAVASEVKELEKGVGMGIASAAKAIGLDFIPIADESYDLLMKKEFYESEEGQALIQVLRSETLNSKIQKIDGYEVTSMEDPIFI